ncbi:hypothetical protein [Rufibacter sp. XAAS-G3-1]|uniref:hypothetical protein n=1 Tax=Rufibacter sp. XAAS-G3-1 TaxID=2729134 RepID=UPI0015E74DA7|nr:hypothetical protein [Rufibacter sp. XAAS-G3-1]
MGKVTNALFLTLLLTVFGACERVKEKEAVADLPETSVEDTLVLTPDTLEIETALTETGTTTPPSMVVDPYSDAKAHTLTSEGTPKPSTAVMTSSPVSRYEAPTKASGAGTTAKRKYVKPTQQQLQRSLALDARKSNQMDLPQLKDYWMRRQDYYRRASKNVKYVAGDTKIKISQEETKIETPRGKVKIEGDDIKIKYD